MAGVRYHLGQAGAGRGGAGKTFSAFASLSALLCPNWKPPGGVVTCSRSPAPSLEPEPEPQSQFPDKPRSLLSHSRLTVNWEGTSPQGWSVPPAPRRHGDASWSLSSGPGGPVSSPRTHSSHLPTSRLGHQGASGLRPLLGFSQAPPPHLPCFPLGGPVTPGALYLKWVGNFQVRNSLAPSPAPSK